jgi:hypothetical protein
MVLVPHDGSILPACDEALRGLEALGYTVRRDGRPDSVPLKRSRMATEALDADIDEILWIDSDMVFVPADVALLRSRGCTVIGGLYAYRGQPQFAYRPLPETYEVGFGEKGGPVQVKHVGTGFLLTHRSVYRDIALKLDLPWCGAETGELVVPYFAPMVFEDPEHGMAYIGEDYSFCERARQAGHGVMLDTSIRLGHEGGAYAYGWEDVVPRPPPVGGGTLKALRKK